MLPNLPGPPAITRMSYTPRTIGLLCELLHPPQPLETTAIQRIHNRIFEAGHPVYHSFNVSAESAVLSNPMTKPGAVSSVAFLQDRLQFREELSGITTDEFVARIDSIVSMTLEERPIQIFTAQIATVRTLINPKQFRDSRDYLRDGMLHFGSELMAFGRDPQLYGLRMVFAPTAEEPHAFTLRVESFASDPRSIFIEGVGSFGPTVVANGTQGLGENVQRTYDFLIERTLPFLSHFDQRQEV